MKYFIVLTLCSIAVFIAVLRVRPQIATINSSYNKQEDALKSSKTVTERPAGRLANTTQKSNGVSSPSPSPTPDDTNSNTHSDENYTSLLRPGFGQGTVASDTAAVYATNSLSSRVLKILNKGDQVETDLAVMDSEGSWSLIRVLDQRISGYVRSENLKLNRPPKSEN